MAFDWTIYKGDVEWLRQRTIFVTLTGSRAYGTHLPTSDSDYHGVCIAPKAYYHGFLRNFKQAVQTKPHPDLTIYEIRKFVSLAANSNPNVIELLFADPSSYQHVSPAWERIVAVRESFLSRRAKHTFSGYALSQLKRINTHYRWLKNLSGGPSLRTGDRRVQLVCPRNVRAS